MLLLRRRCIVIVSPSRCICAVALMCCCMIALSCCCAIVLSCCCVGWCCKREINLKSAAPSHCRRVAVAMYSCCCIAVLLHDRIVTLLCHRAVVSASVASVRSCKKFREMVPGHAEMLPEKTHCCLDKEPSGSWSVEGCHVICGVGE